MFALEAPQCCKALTEFPKVIYHLLNLFCHIVIALLGLKEGMGRGPEKNSESIEDLVLAE